MPLPRDAHAQPPRALYAERVNDRLLAEMLGICKGVICDGVVNDAEAVALMQWIRAHPDVAVGFPGALVLDRLRAVFADGMIDDAEREDLQGLMRDLVGEPEDLTGEMNHATRLDFDAPPPTVFFEGKLFCFTGRFARGSRKHCEQCVRDRGGRVLPHVTQQTDYLVVGTFGSGAWIYPTHGTKFEDAYNLRANGARVAIVAEEHWFSAVSYDA